MFRRFASRPVRLGGLTLGGLAILLFFLPGTFWGDDRPTVAKTEGLDPHIRKVLPILINQGAEIYNGGNLDACCRLYESTLLVVRPALADHPQAQRVIDKGLADALKISDASERAFALRAVLDAIKAEVASRRTATPKQAAGFTPTKEEQEILDLTNAERKKAGLPALKGNGKLFQAARAHSANMARQEILAHTLDSEGPGERLKKVGYRSMTWGENCAAGQRTPEEAISSWMGSEGHRKNILNEQFSEIGIGIAVSPGGTRYYTQVFGTPAGQ